MAHKLERMDQDIGVERDVFAAVGVVASFEAHADIDLEKNLLDRALDALMILGDDLIVAQYGKTDAFAGKIVHVALGLLGAQRKLLDAGFSGFVEDVDRLAEQRLVVAVQQDGRIPLLLLDLS